MARIKIDLATGTFEAEGDDNFVKDLYDDFKDAIAKKQSEQTEHPKRLGRPEDQTDGLADQRKAKGATKKAAGSSSRKESYSIVKDLNLRAGDITLKDFYAKHMPSNGMEHATVFVYYLKKILQTPNVSPDHIYTCYKEVGKPVPKALKQSLFDTANRKGSIDTADVNDIQLTTIGENMVEYDLPSKEATK